MRTRKKVHISTLPMIEGEKKMGEVLVVVVMIVEKSVVAVIVKLMVLVVIISGSYDDNSYGVGDACDNSSRCGNGSGGYVKKKVCLEVVIHYTI